MFISLFLFFFTSTACFESLCISICFLLPVAVFSYITYFIYVECFFYGCSAGEARSKAPTMGESDVNVT